MPETKIDEGTNGRWSLRTYLMYTSDTHAVRYTSLYHDDRFTGGVFYTYNYENTAPNGSKYTVVARHNSKEQYFSEEKKAMTWLMLSCGKEF